MAKKSFENSSSFLENHFRPIYRQIALILNTAYIAIGLGICKKALCILSLHRTASAY